MLIYTVTFNQKKKNHLMSIIWDVIPANPQWYKEELNTIATSCKMQSN